MDERVWAYCPTCRCGFIPQLVNESEIRQMRELHATEYQIGSGSGGETATGRMLREAHYSRANAMFNRVLAEGAAPIVLLDEPRPL